VRDPINLTGVLLVDAGLAAGFLGLLSLVKPLRFLGIRTWRRGGLWIASGALLGVAGMALPAPLRRVPAKLSRLDEIVPAYQFVEHHEIRVHASPERVHDAVWKVTALEIELFDLPTVYAGAAFFPIERASEALHAWRELTQKVDDRTTSIGRILRVPPFEDIPEPFRGKHFAMVEVIHIGDQRSGDDVVEAIRDLEPAIDTYGLIPTAALIHLHMDPPGPVPGKGEHHVAMATLPAEAIDAFVAANGADSASDILTAEIRHLGGAIARPDASNGAAHIDAEYISFAASMAVTPDMAAKAEQDLAKLDAALAPYSSARKYLNFTETPSAPDEFFEKATLDRLRAVKTRVDPEGIFRSNQPID
jgi:FAD/FMN-containing dehydrogenase